MISTHRTTDKYLAKQERRLKKSFKNQCSQNHPALSYWNERQFICSTKVR